MMELEDDFIDGNFEFPQESEPTAEQELRPTPKTTKKRAALADIDTNIEPADKEAGEKPRKKKNRGSKEKEHKTPEETGVILQLEEFDEQQKTTQGDEMCKDLKLIVNTVTKMEQSMQVFQKSCQEVMEKELQSMQKKIDELGQKLIEYTPQPVLQPFSPPLAQVYNAMQPATLFHSVPPASSYQATESPMGQSAPIPIAPLSTKYNEMSAVEIPKEKLKTLAEALQKFSSLRTESKIGVLAVKLAREAIFGDDVLRRCTPRGWSNMPALPQAELNLLKCTLFEQFPRFWTCPEEYEKTWAIAQEAIAQACKRLRKRL